MLSFYKNTSFYHYLFNVMFTHTVKIDNFYCKNTYWTVFNILQFEIAYIRNKLSFNFPNFIEINKIQATLHILNSSIKN